MHLEIEPLDENLTHSQTQRSKGRLRTINNFAKSYFEHSTIHGWAYLVKRNLTLIEKFLWLISIIISMYFCALVGMKTVERFYYQSTVVGLERDFYYWNTSLPSVTVCPLKRLDPKLFDTYCRAKNIDPTLRPIFFNFLETLANSTYENFKLLQSNPAIDDLLLTLRIKPENYMELIYNLTNNRIFTDIAQLKNNHERVTAIGGSGYVHAWQVLTEHGLCYITNTNLERKYSSDYFIFGKYPRVNFGDLPFTRVITRMLYDIDREYSLAGFINTSIDSFLHSNYDVAKIDANFGFIPYSRRFEVQVQEINAEEGFEEGASVFQRKCRFQHESNLTHFPIYTRGLCIQECRINLVFKVCHCIPHFYPNRFGKPKPVCDYKVLRKCFPPHKDSFLKLYKDHDAITCSSRCLQNCLDSMVNLKYQMIENQSDFLFGGNGITVGMTETPTSRLKRQIIFSFTDLLVSIGGAAGLFLGFSVLSAMEIIYFLSLRVLFCFLRGYVM